MLLIYYIYLYDQHLNSVIMNSNNSSVLFISTASGDATFVIFFTFVPCILILPKLFIYQQMHKTVALKEY